MVPAWPNADVEHPAVRYWPSIIDPAIPWHDGAGQGLSGHAFHFMKEAT